MEQKETKNKINKPKFILSKNAVYNQINILNDVFDGISYSWKTNPLVGQILIEKDLTEISIISTNELIQFVNSGGQEKTNLVWFFAMALNDESLDLICKKYKVNKFVIENLTDLKTLKNYIKKNDIKVDILLRMKLRENTISTGKHYVFGMKTEEVKKEILELRENKNVNKLGIHFHRKTQNVSEWNLKREVEASLGSEILSKIDILNLGGGLPSNYMNIHDKALTSIFMRINELKDYTNQFGIKMIIEPGRFIAAPAVKLETQIILIHDNALFLNCSIFNGTLDTVIANVKLHVQEEIEQGTRYILKGCTPDSCDILRYSVILNNPQIGDKITLLNCGAYTYQTNFCALDHIETEIVEVFDETENKTTNN